MGSTGGAGAAASGNPYAIGLTVAGGAMSAAGSYFAGKANQHIANDNAQIAGDQAIEAQEAGNFAMTKAQEQGVQTAARAAAGQTGTVSGAGTGGLVEQSSLNASNVDALMIQRNAVREALGYTSKGVAEEMQGEQAAEQGRIGGISTLLNAGEQSWLESDPSYAGLRGSGINLSGRS